MTTQKKPSRRQQILFALASELERNPGKRITTAELARAVGVSEAALYRHFPSKARMYEGLIEFIEESIFTLINRIMAEEKEATSRCEKLLQLLLGFAARNPGLCRILTGDALVGETDRLRVRIIQFYDRIETQLKQVLREGIAHGELSETLDVSASANVLLSFAEGRIGQFVRSGFERDLTTQLPTQWRQLLRSLQTPTG